MIIKILIVILLLFVALLAGLSLLAAFTALVCKDGGKAVGFFLLSLAFIFILIDSFI